MLAQVGALVTTSQALKATVADAVDFINTSNPITQEDLNALTTVNATLTDANKALGDAVTTARAK